MAPGASKSTKNAPRPVWTYPRTSKVPFEAPAPVSTPPGHRNEARLGRGGAGEPGTRSREPGSRKPPLAARGEQHGSARSGGSAGSCLVLPGWPQRDPPRMARRQSGSPNGAPPFCLPPPSRAAAIHTWPQAAAAPGRCRPSTGLMPVPLHHNPALTDGATLCRAYGPARVAGENRVRPYSPPGGDPNADIVGCHAHRRPRSGRVSMSPHATRMRRRPRGVTRHAHPFASRPG